ncbi:MAG: hypothetical protein R3C19_05415 [Planctomycetaceae bacterium]
MTWTDRELTAWLDEMLPVDRMTQLEQQLRDDAALQRRIAAIIRDRDQGGHTVGEIWQRERLSCPGRSELGGYLLGTLTAEAAAYVEFHLLTAGCRVCQANLKDLEDHATAASDAPVRRKRFFESSAGLLSQPDSGEEF